MSAFRIVIIGGYGQFGRRIAAALANDPTLVLILAGRHRASADAEVRLLEQKHAQATLATAHLDVEAPTLQADLQRLAVQLVIHTAGPFQQRDYRVAEAALHCGAHYIDLADARDFVVGIDRLDAAARAAGRWVVSGASSVPGLSAAVVESCIGQFARLESVDSAISPGNRTPRGLATTRAILSYVGHPIAVVHDGRPSVVHGWQSLRRLRIAGVGTRWVARCDVPDLAVLPQRYPQLRDCEFRAGLELRRMHFGLWAASWLVRFGGWSRLSAWAGPLLRVSESWAQAGSDIGVMRVDMAGLGQDGEALRLRWQLLAADGSGPQVPATAAVVLARALARGALVGGGARACVDLFSLEDFMQELAGFPISVTLQRLPG